MPYFFCSRYKHRLLLPQICKAPKYHLSVFWSQAYRPLPGCIKQVSESPSQALAQRNFSNFSEVLFAPEPRLLEFISIIDRVNPLHFDRGWSSLHRSVNFPDELPIPNPTAATRPVLLCATWFDLWRKRTFWLEKKAWKRKDVTWTGTCRYIQYVYKISCMRSKDMYLPTVTYNGTFLQAKYQSLPNPTKISWNNMKISSLPLHVGQTCWLDSSVHLNSSLQLKESDVVLYTSVIPVVNDDLFDLEFSFHMIKSVYPINLWPMLAVPKERWHFPRTLGYKGTSSTP